MNGAKSLAVVPKHCSNLQGEKGSVNVYGTSDFSVLEKGVSDKFWYMLN